MNKYELGVVIRADLDEESFRSEMDRVKALFDRFGGVIDKIDEWGRRKLAYPIQKQSEGMYTFITYSAEGNVAQEVESRLRLMESVLRFITVRLDERTPKIKPKKPVPDSSTEEPVGEPIGEPEEAVAQEVSGEVTPKESAETSGEVTPKGAAEPQNSSSDEELPASKQENAKAVTE